MDERTVDAEDKKLWPIAVERHFIEVLLEVDAKGNMPQGQFKTGTWTIVMNKFNKHTNRDYNKTQLTQKYQRMKGQHRTFSQLIAHTGMGWDPISNTVTASEETWATAFAELPTPSEAQSRRQAEKRPAKPSHSSGKRKKGHSLKSMTEAIWSFTKMRNRGRGKKSTDTREFGVGADSESITRAVTLLNQHTDVDHVTYCKVVQELHNPKSRVAFFAMTVDRRRA
nr:l10-interacting myb domain-containing protein [Quercus suber]